MTSLRVPMLSMLVSLYSVSVLGVQIFWGDNPDLVDQSNPRQGKEDIKLMVSLVGDNIDLQCLVVQARQPVRNINWKINGGLVNTPDSQTVISNGKVFAEIEDHFKIDNITEDKDGSKVSCEYSKGHNADRLTAIFHVLEAEIVTSGDVCDNCNGDVKLAFESKGSSSGEANVERRIKSRIADMTNTNSDEITAINGKYSVVLPIGTVKNNPAILAMQHMNNGSVGDSLAECNCEYHGIGVGAGIGICIIGILFVMGVGFNLVPFLKK
eukprot:GFUD01135535.1.p1 GENE.GFUD01135535.1~~GFUD01135535.1.p1  ORF type:complete len:268 (-),score=38.60 GFUD01135535.1:50-853(-)